MIQSPPLFKANKKHSLATALIHWRAQMLSIGTWSSPNSPNWWPLPRTKQEVPNTRPRTIRILPQSQCLVKSNARDSREWGHEIRTMQDAIAVHHDLGLSCYPIVFMEKRCMLGVGWKVYQQRVPTVEELGLWHYNYSLDNGGPGYGIAIPTGYGAGSSIPYALDCDNGVPTTIEQCHTITIEHGGRGPCFVFNGPPSMGPAKLVVNIDGTEVDLKGLGGSFTAPVSVYKNGTPYPLPSGAWLESDQGSALNAHTRSRGLCNEATIAEIAQRSRV